MRKYKVIWFDDEFQTLNIIREKAYLCDVELIGFGNASEGIDELKKNIKGYDAAIIDGIFFNNPNQGGTPTSDKALFDVATTIKELASSKVLPWFILSGQPSFTKEKNRFADGLKDNQVYDKLNDTHLSKLWEDIKAEADRQMETQIRHKYQNAFAVCSEKYLGDEAAKPLLFLLETVESPTPDSNTEDKLNAARKIVEKIFAAFNRIKILPDEVWRANGNINNSSKVLAGSHLSYSLTVEVFPPAVAFLVKNILHMTQDGSHAEGDLNLRLDYFIKSQPTGYLFNGVIFQLLEVLVWLKIFFDRNPDVIKNSTFVARKATVGETFLEGIIEQDESRNYHCRDAILTYKHFGKNGYKVGDKIRIIKHSINTNEKTAHLYAKSAMISEKI